MKLKKIQMELLRLEAEIARHNLLYFDQNAPEIDDATYDGLRQQVAKIHQEIANISTNNLEFKGNNSKVCQNKSDIREKDRKNIESIGSIGNDENSQNIGNIDNDEDSGNTLPASDLVGNNTTKKNGGNTTIDTTEKNSRNIFKAMLLHNPKGENPANSIPSLVGAEPNVRFNKIAHTTQMLSLDNAFSESDLLKFYDRVLRLIMQDQDALNHLSSIFNSADEQINLDTATKKQPINLATNSVSTPILKLEQDLDPVLQIRSNPEPQHDHAATSKLDSQDHAENSKAATSNLEQQHDHAANQKNSMSKQEQSLKYNLEFICEPKIDGLSFAAVYNNGVLQYALTRGNGIYGEDITANFRTIVDIPLTIAYDGMIEVRGEVYMNKADFLRLNSEQRTKGEQEFANPRNAAAGSLRQLDHSITAARNLRYFAWGGSCSNIISERELLMKFKSLGFNVVEHRICQNIEQLESYYKQMEEKRSSLEYDIDGVVYKIDDLQTQQNLGTTSNAPRWATAYKFAAETATTVIKHITVQVSRSGVLTPVAELQPVNIGGVLISRATLHNFDEIQRHDFRIGDTVVVKRAGDVIPKVMKIKPSLRPENTRAYRIPIACPSCEGRVQKDSYDGAIYRCYQTSICPEQLIMKMVHFVSQNGMNIMGLGENQIRQLYKDQLLETAFHIVLLPRDQEKLKKIALLPGFGEKSVTNLVESVIYACNNIKLTNFIYSLGIRHVGLNTANVIAKRYGSWDSFRMITANKDPVSVLASINGIGPKIANAIVEYMYDYSNLTMLDNMTPCLKIADHFIKQSHTSQIAGKTIVFTGTLANITRTKAKEIAEKAGAHVGNSVSAATNYVVAGIDTGSKLQKANMLGIKVISEEDFMVIAGN